MPSVRWVEPIMTWDGNGLDENAAPAVMEFESDNFIPDFLAAMAVNPAEEDDNNEIASPETYLQNNRKNGSDPWTLYHPLHSRYYLVTGALICRQLGLPDKEVAVSEGERTTFVIRRIENGQEMAWVEDQGWQEVSDRRDLYRRKRGGPPAEEQLPLHAVAARTGIEAEFSPQPKQRQVYYGYIPVGNRQKYREAESPAPESTEETDPTAKDKIQAYHAQFDGEPDYRLAEYNQRVAEPWADLIAQGGITDASQQKTASLYVLLDLGDFLQRALSTVWDAIKQQNKSLLDGKPKHKALYEVLDKDPDSEDSSKPILIKKGSDWVTVGEALRSFDPQDFTLVNGNGDDVQEPTTPYDVSNPHQPDGDDGEEPISEPEKYFNPSFREGGTLADLVQAALTEEDSSMDLADAEERLRMLNAQVPPAADADGEYHYRLRLVYEYDPECPPIVSEPSREFTLAPLLDPAAPARQVKIELPSIKMQDLRKFTHGVGMQMTPELRNVINRIHKDVVDEGLAPAASVGLSMVCTFSIQIITLVAFVVMFIFLIALNFIFWWLPFLKICFPIPSSSDSS